MLIGSKELIRDMNSKLILQLIISNQQISRATLATKTGLTKATVSSIVANLIRRDLILESESTSTTLGRKPIMLTFNATCGYTISIDLNITTITVLVTDLLGQEQAIFHYSHCVNQSTILADLTHYIRTALMQLPTSRYGLIGIGIGIHGIVCDNHISFSPYAPYAALPFQSTLSATFSVPVYLENESNLSVIGEHAFCHPISNILDLNIDTGIGAGIILHHTLYSGMNGGAGEFGHTIVEPDGRPCPCGNNGCLEQYASEQALLTQFAQHLQVARVTIPEFVSAVQQQDPTALQLVTDFTHYIALALNNLINIFAPEMIVLNSSLFQHFPTLLTNINALVHSKANCTCNIQVSTLSNSSILLGASCVCIRQFLQVDDLIFTKPPLEQ